MKLLQTLFSYKFIIGLFLFLSLAFLFERNIRFTPNENDEFKQAQTIIKSKTQKVDQILNELETKLDSISLLELMNNQNFIPSDLNETEGIVFLGYSGDSLIFWSDNSIPVENYQVNNQLYNDLSKLKNGWYVVRHNYIDDYELFGLILLKNEYTYQNEFIKSDFFNEYEINVPVSIVLDDTKGYLINDYQGNYLFSLELKSNLIYSRINVILSSIFYFIAILFLFLGIKKLFFNIRQVKAKYFYVIALLALLILLRYLMLEYHFPKVFRQLELFQPHHFAISLFMPSLGDFLLHSVFIFFSIPSYII
ncbi:hypothetical protein ACFLQ3_01660 [Bacteroidota bacterium]